ncbi:pentapeptide repeats (9 copies) [Rhodobiaceae bacterium]|nr:pentapeptide repeats (9 copies) [Rhodobiaceae bacterium]
MFAIADVEKRAANLAAWPLAAAAIVIAIPFYQTVGEYEMLGFKYWGGEGFNRMEVIRNFALIVGGFLGLWLAWRRIVLMDQQTEVALQDSSRTEKQNIAERFERAVDLLNSEELQFKHYGAIRMMGIATADPDEYLTPAIHLMCVAVREIANKETISREHSGPVHDVVREIVTYIFDLGETFELSLGDEAPIDLRNTYLHGMTLVDRHVRGDSVSGCVFNDFDFEGCTFKGWFGEDLEFQEVEFRDCDLRRGAFRSAQYVESGFLRSVVGDHSFMGCRMSGTLFNVLLWPTNTQHIFTRCDLSGTDFAYADDDEDLQRYEFQKDAVHTAEYTPDSFRACTVEHEDALPTGLEFNEPPLAATAVKSETGSGYNLVVDFRDRKEREDD